MDDSPLEELLTPDVIWALLLAVYDATLDDDRRESLHDAAMDVLLKVHQRLIALEIKFSTRGNLIRYVRRAVKNGLIDELRREKNRAYLETLPETPFYRKTSRRLETEEIARPLFESLRSMHPMIYESFKLHELDGVTWREIAELLKRGSTVAAGEAWRVHCHRVLRSLRNQFPSTEGTSRD